MIAYLKGTIIDKTTNNIIVDVNGVGYCLICSAFTVSESATINSVGEFYCYMAIKQDAIELYGFNSLEEKEVFLSLITVTGVGVKSAIQILSNMHYRKVAGCIESGDPDTLTTAKACSKKTAERLILELKNKKFYFAEGVSKNNVEIPSILNEAIMALVSLGLNKKEATIRAGEVFLGDETTPEEIVKKALKNF